MERELNIGDALSNSFDLFARGWKGATIVLLVAGAVSGLLTLSVFMDVSSGNLNRLLELDAIATMVLVSFVSVLAGCIVLALAARVQNAADGAGDQLGDAVSDVLAAAGPLVLVSIITSIGIAIGMMLLIIPGVIIGVAWALAVPAVLFEDRAPVDALKRSWSLVKPQFAPMLGLGVVLALISIVASMVLTEVVGAIVPGFNRAEIVLANAVSEVPNAIVAFGIWSAWLQLTGNTPSSGDPEIPPSQRPGPSLQ